MGLCGTHRPGMRRSTCYCSSYGLERIDGIIGYLAIAAACSGNRLACYMSIGYCPVCSIES